MVSYNLNLLIQLKIFLLDFIITDKSGDINIEQLKLTGLDFYQTSNILERSENDIIHNHLNIFGSGRYTLPQTHIYSSLINLKI